MNHGFSGSRCRGLILPYLSASGSIWLCVWVGLVRIYYYSHQGNTHTKAKISHCTLPKFPAWPMGMHSILASLSALFRSGYLFILSVPAKFKVSRPVIGDFTPPSSPQRWNIFSHGLPTCKALGRFSHILVHLGPFGFVCGWAW